MARNCICCNKQKGIFDEKTHLLDGIICKECLTKVKIPSNITLRHISSTKMKEICSERSTFVNHFTKTNQFGGMQVDSENKLFRIENGIFKYQIFNYSNLSSFELVEDNIVTSSGGLGAAIVGGLVAGGVGAVVGGIVAEKTSASKTCDSLKLKLELVNTYTDTLYIDFIKSPTQKKSSFYKLMLKSAEDLSRFLNNVIVYNTEKKQVIQKSSRASYQHTSLADEIQKIKELLDNGAITKMEYDVLKKKIIES
ncbi:MAG: SHOCT domain-containing protein [Eubacteriales bacterium]